MLTGVVTIILGALLVGTNVWLAGAAFEPMARDGGSVDYLLVSPSFNRLAVDVLAAAAALLLLQLFQRRANPREPFLSGANTRYLHALGWMALSLVPLVNLFAPLAGRMPAFSYILFDLRLWWWPLVLIRVVLLARVGPGFAGWPAVSQRWIPASVIVLSIASALAFTPYLRFSGALDGDEPKYLRYCENFYQGLGFDVSSHRLLTDAANDGPHALDNVRHFLRAVPEEAALLAGDARRLVGAPAPPRLAVMPDMFFEGKHRGSVYQFHNPGLSFLLFPGYYLDRRATGSGIGYQNEFPEFMPAVHVTLLALYAGYALALFGLLTAYGGSRRLAWLLALVGVVTIPTGAFAFQIYPEIAAGLILFVLVRDLILMAPQGKAASVVMGLLAGFLPWLHTRFGLAAVVLVAWMLATRVRPLRTRLCFTAGAAAALVGLSLYMYRLTGSLLPIVPPSGGEDVFTLARVLNGVPGFFVDRFYGLFPHAPVYLLALPGIALAWRRRMGAPWILALIMAVVVPAASQGFRGAGATPGRYLVAAAPLLLLFVSDAMNAWSRRRMFVAAFVALTLVSIETAARYNLNHLKGIGPLVAKEFSGWRLNLLFPSVGALPWPTTPRDAALLVSWGVVIALLVSIPFWRTPRPEPLADRGATLAMAPLGAVFGILLAIALLGTVVSAATGETMDRAYFAPAREARDRVLMAFADVPRCALCYSSALGAVEPAAALDNDVTFVDLRTGPASARAGQPVGIRVRPRNVGGDYVVGLVRLEMGDGSTATYRRVFGDVYHIHTYARPGEYQVHAWVKSSSADPVEARVIFRVAP